MVIACRHIIAAALALASGAAAAQELDIRPGEAPAECGSSALQVEATIHGVTAQGILTVELYEPSERDFLRKASRLKRVRVPAEEGAQTVCFDVPQPGEYALAAYHDIDADRELARKWNRLPAEPFALSNDEPLRLRMPRFEDAAFAVGEDGAAAAMTLQQP